MTGRRGVRALLVLALLAPAAPAGAWGLAAHRWVAMRAAELARERCPDLTERPRLLADAAVEPDTVLKQRDGRAEVVRHFLNLDHYGAPPFRGLPRDRRAAEARFGRATVEREGVLPWHGAEVARRLRDQLRRGDVGAARTTAGHLAHYAADATMPLHATENHDGQRSGQRGVHRRVEARLVDADLADFTRRAWKVARRRPLAPDGAAGALFAALEQAYGGIDGLLAADARARRDTKVGSRLYYRRLHGELVEPLAVQLGAAAALTAALWEGACQSASDR